MLWLYIDFPSLQLDCLQASKNDCIKKNGTADLTAIVIVDAKKNCIVQLNTPAFEQGIRLGMGLAMASSLAAKLCVLPYKKSAEEACLVTLAEQLYSVTANIALFPPHGLALQVDDMLKLYHQLEHYINTVYSVLAPFKLKTCFACGYNAISAQLLACAGIELITNNSSKIDKAIARVAIGDMFVSQQTKDHLARLGIKKMAQLQALPMAELAKRLDSNTINYLAELNGKRSKSLVLYQPEHKFEHSIELLYEIATIAVLLHPIKNLLLLLEAYLQRRDYLCLQIELTFFLTENTHNLTQQSLLIASASREYLAKHWLNLVSLKLTNIKLLAPVIRVKLLVKQFEANTGEIDDIFLGKIGQLSLAQLASLLVNKLGDEKVQRIQLGNDHRAEHASHYVPFIRYQAVNHQQNICGHKRKKFQVNNHSKTLATNEKAVIDKLPQRPIFILPTPEPLLFEVSVLHGPERIDTAWWDRPIIPNSEHVEFAVVAPYSSYQRDYFIAKNAQGQCCWVYREFNNQWYIHGYFS